jgi:transcription elongation factor Elf1
MANKKIECPVCSCGAVQTTVPHTDFEASVFVCAQCGHGWTDYNKVFQSDEVFKTFTARADAYSKLIVDNCPDMKSVLELGSAHDFYFLKKLHALRPDVKLYLTDSFDYSDCVPEYITFIRSLSALPERVDVTYMSHVLEHIGPINEFLKLLKRKSRFLMLEMPCKTPEYFKAGAKMGWHYQFFNEESFKRLMKKHGIKIIDLTAGESKFIKRCKVIYAYVEL